MNKNISSDEKSVFCYKTPGMMESKNVIYGDFAIRQGYKVGVKLDMGAGKLSFVASSPSNY